jgi:hypothetical protein
MKTCNKCNKSKAEDEYGPKRRKCKTCIAEEAKKYYEKNRDKIKERNKKWKEKNREKCRETEKRWRENNPDYKKQWVKKNPEKRKAIVARWRAKNPEKVRARANRWHARNPGQSKRWRKKNPEKAKLQSRKRRAKPSFKIKARLKNNFRDWLLKGKKSLRMERLVGCTREEARNWIEAQFLPGMTWENYGAWHIDHMLPWEHFNLLDEGTHPQVMHYTNLQPLWGPDNSIKGSKIIYDMEWRDTWYIHTGTEYVCRKIQVENKINISVKPIVESFHGFAHAFATT